MPASRDQGRPGSVVAGARTAPPDVPTGSAIAVSSAELFAAYQPRIRGYILSMVRDPTEADDLTQEVFLRAHRQLGSLRDPNAALSWLYRVATNVSYDRFRQRSRQPRRDPRDVSDSPAADVARDDSEDARLDRMMERAEMSACVKGDLEDLSDDYRQVILLHDTQGLTNAVIAEMLGVSVDAVKIRLHRARRKLEAALAAHCDFSRDEQNVFVCDPAPPRR
jgi:RNA polymerase sigma-70 factor, ECF subfamily